MNNKKPPIGIQPKFIWEVQRIEDLVSAMNRYINAGLEIPVEWVENYNELIIKYENVEECDNRG